jgi:hypothetical protein
MVDPTVEGDGDRSQAAEDRDGLPGLSLLIGQVLGWLAAHVQGGARRTRVRERRCPLQAEVGTEPVHRCEALIRDSDAWIVGQQRQILIRMDVVPGAHIHVRNREPCRRDSPDHLVPETPGERHVTAGM